MPSLRDAAVELQARAADWWRQKRYEARPCAAPCVAPCGAAREPRVVRVRDEPEGADSACLGPLHACVCAALQLRRPGVRFHHAADCDNHSHVAALADHHCWRRIQRRGAGAEASQNAAAAGEGKHCCNRARDHQQYMGKVARRLATKRAGRAAGPVNYLAACWAHLTLRAPTLSHDRRVVLCRAARLCSD